LTLGQAFDLAYRRFLDSQYKNVDTKKQMLLLQQKVCVYIMLQFFVLLTHILKLIYMHNTLAIILYWMFALSLVQLCLQCFDTVIWASGRASSL